MQAITHLAIGALIQRIIEAQNYPPYLSVFIIICLAFLSHIFLDAIANITYHPPTPRKTTFWYSYHLFVLVSSVLFVIIFIQYWLGMLFANLPDIIDWLILRNYYWIKRKNRRFDISFIHKKVIDSVAKKCFWWLPDLREKEWSAINELLIIAILILMLIVPLKV